MSLPAHIRVCCANGHPLIFERPYSQHKSVRRAMMLVTGIGWAAWLSLWRPALTILPWLFGIDSMHHHWAELPGWDDFLHFELHTAPYGRALCVVLLIWALFNYLRFRGNDRRKERPLATPEDDARWTRTSAKVLSESRSSQSLVCFHDEEGHLIDVVSNADERRQARSGNDQAIGVSPHVICKRPPEAVLTLRP